MTPADIEALCARLKTYAGDHEILADACYTMTDAATALRSLQARVRELEQRDSEAATYVESVIAMRTNFSGEPPYVGWKGLGLSLKEALDERDALRAECEGLRKDAERYRWLKSLGGCAWDVAHEGGWHTTYHRHDQMDAAVDAAMAAGEKP